MHPSFGEVNAVVVVVGVAPEAHLYALKALGGELGFGSVLSETMAIEWAIDHRANVINMSLGADMPAISEEIACNRAYSAGILLVAVSGNAGFGVDSDVDYPAKYDSVVAVAATDNSDQREE